MTDAPPPSPAPVTASPEPRPQLRLPGWLDVGLAIGASPLLIAIVRLLAYSAGDPVALKVLVQTLDVRAILLGSILPVLPALLFAAANYLLVAGAMKSWEGLGIARGLLTALCVVGLLAYAWLGPLPQAVVSIGALLATLAVVQLVIRLVRRRRGRRAALRLPFTTPRRLLLFLAPALGLAVVFILPQGMWLPLEQVTLTDGTVHRGYVLDLSSNWATMIDDRRVVEILPAPLIEDRTVCDQGEALSLALLLTREGATPDTPRCS